MANRSSGIIWPVLILKVDGRIYDNCEERDKRSIEECSEEGEQKFDKLETSMHMPPAKIKDLLTAIASQPSGFRWMNACGALKTLSNIPANRVQLAWTKGVVPTLAYVLNDEYASLTEKQRPASMLLNLFMPKRNHVVVFQSPGFIDGISNSLRSICLKTKNTAQCVDILAKHNDNKVSMWNEHNLIQAITVHKNLLH